MRLFGVRCVRISHAMHVHGVGLHHAMYVFSVNVYASVYCLRGIYAYIQTCSCSPLDRDLSGKNLTTLANVNIPEGTTYLYVVQL
jgi:hypothetical protein